MKMTRKQVYKLVDGEREYQDNLPPTRTDGVERTVGDYITMLQYYNNKLIEAWTMNPGNEQALDVMRKIAGIAVHCMEDWGAPGRAIPGDVDAIMKSRKKEPKIQHTQNREGEDVTVSWPFPPLNQP